MTQRCKPYKILYLASLCNTILAVLVLHNYYTVPYKVFYHVSFKDKISVLLTVKFLLTEKHNAPLFTNQSINDVHKVSAYD